MTTFKCDLSTLRQSMIAQSKWDTILTKHDQCVDLYGELRGPRGRQDSRVFPLRKNTTRSPRRPTGPTSYVNYATSMGVHLKLTTE